jgi:hypothetical protein
MEKEKKQTQYRIENDTNYAIITIPNDCSIKFNKIINSSHNIQNNKRFDYIFCKAIIMGLKIDVGQL